MKDLFKQDDFNQQYALAREIGDKRFGSECQHIRTRNGYCLDCFRKVIEMREVEVHCALCGKSESSIDLDVCHLCGTSFCEITCFADHMAWHLAQKKEGYHVTTPA